MQIGIIELRKVAAALHKEFGGHAVKKKRITHYPTNQFEANF
ncbi:hypothetical protein [Flavobacterium sp. LB2P6]